MNMKKSELNGAESDEKKIIPFQGYSLVAINIILLAVNISLGIFLLNSASNILNFAKLFILLGLLETAALIDFKKKIIPNLIIYIGFACRIIIYILEFIISRNDFTNIIVNDLIGFAIGFGILFVVSIVTRQSIGFGDVKLFGIIGLLSGTICTYTTLFASMVISAIISIALLIAKKRGRKDTISFGPCIVIGYCISLIIGSF